MLLMVAMMNMTTKIIQNNGNNDDDDDGDRDNDDLDCDDDNDDAEDNVNHNTADVEDVAASAHKCRLCR